MSSSSSGGSSSSSSSSSSSGSRISSNGSGSGSGSTIGFQWPLVILSDCVSKKYCVLLPSLCADIS